MSEAPSTPWEGDSLRRAEIARKIRQIIGTMTSGGAFGLDAPFGHGKTFFLAGLSAELKAEHYTVAYFDAWKADLAERPLFHFVTSLLAQLAAQGIEATGKPALAKKVAKLAASVARIGIKSILRAGDDDFDALLAPLDEEIDGLDFSKKGAAADALALADDIECARAAFADVVQALLVAPGKKLPLVVLIDELDRARPDFAIDLLEALKFIFATEHVVFCASVDKSNLNSTIRARFGDAYDADHYLSRIFSFWIALENPPANREFLAARLKSRGLVDDHVLSDDRDLEGGVLAAAQFGVAGLGPKNSNLRSLDRCAERIAICARQGGNKIGAVALMAGLSISNQALLQRLVAESDGSLIDDAAALQDLMNHIGAVEDIVKVASTTWFFSPRWLAGNSMVIERAIGAKNASRIPIHRDSDYDAGVSEGLRTMRRLGWILRS